MDTHAEKCDCSHCNAPSELSSLPSMQGKLDTKADIAIHRRAQEYRVLKHIKEVVDSKTRSMSINEEAKTVINGILSRRRRLKQVFTISEVQILLAAWKYQQNQSTSPHPIMSMFLQEVMEPHAPKAYQVEKVQLDMNGRKRAAGEDPKESISQTRRDSVNLLFKHGVVRILNDLFAKNPHGLFCFEYGCATFYPNGLRASSTSKSKNLLSSVTAKVSDEKLSPPKGNEKTPLSSQTLDFEDDSPLWAPGMPEIERPVSVFNRMMQPDRFASEKHATSAADQVSLTDRIGSLETSTQKMETTIENILTNVGTLKGAVEGHGTTVEKLETTLDDLMWAIQNLERTLERMQDENRGTNELARGLQQQLEEFLQPISLNFE